MCVSALGGSGTLSGRILGRSRLYALALRRLDTTENSQHGQRQRGTVNAQRQRQRPTRTHTTPHKSNAAHRAIYLNLAAHSTAHRPHTTQQFQRHPRPPTGRGTRTPHTHIAHRVVNRQQSPDCGTLETHGTRTRVGAHPDSTCEMHSTHIHICHTRSQIHAEVWRRRPVHVTDDSIGFFSIGRDERFTNDTLLIVRTHRKKHS